MKISNVLKLAKTRLNRTKYICFAIHNCRISEEDKRRAINHIDSLLGQYSSVFFWLHGEANIKTEFLTEKNMLEYRHRWLDHMISELQKEGQ